MRYAKKVMYVLFKVSETLAQNQVSFKGLKFWEKIKTEIKQMNWHIFKKIVKGQL